MNILITQQLPGHCYKKLTTALPSSAEIHYHRGESLSKTQLIEQARGCDGVLCSLTDQIDQPFFEAVGNQLKVVSTISVGYDHIDLAAARHHNVTVCHTPNVLTDATADLAFALILSLSRRIIAADKYARSGAWKNWDPNLLLGVELKNKTLGIVGFGRIGQAVARRALGFGMRIHYTNPSPKTLSLGDDQQQPVRVSLEELCSTSDIISIHCPMTPETHHLINAKTLSLMSPETLLINTARGPIIEEEALAKALHSKKIAGAGLDVYEHEPHIHNRLLSAPNTVLLPHIGSATFATREAMGNLAIDNLVAVLQGKQPPAAIS